MKRLDNIFLIGPSGAGKSTIGRALAARLEQDFFDSDAEIEKRAGTSISWIFDVEGEPGMRAREVKAIEDLTKRNHIVLATGGGSVLMPENREVLASRGVVFYISVSLDQQQKRTERNLGHRPLLRVADPRAKLIEMQQEREPLYQSIADFTIHTEDYSIAGVVQKIVELIESCKH